MAGGILNVIGMIPKGGKYAKSVVNFVHKVPQNWKKFKSAIQQIDDILKQGKLRLDGKQKTNFEANKNILKTHEKVTKEVEVLPSVTKKYPPFNVSKEDFTKGWTPTLYERSNLRNIYKDELYPPAKNYTKEMEAIDEELDALAFGGEKYASLSSVEKAKIFKKLQAEMDKLIKVAMKDDLSTLSLSQLNKKSQDLQRRIREIADNPDIKGTVYEGPKHDMIAALYKSENSGLTKARHALTRKNSELKYGKTYPVLDPENDAFIITGLDEFGHPNKMSRFIGKFSADRHPITADLTRKEGTAWWDKWDLKKNKMRDEGKEVWHETVDREGKVIMSNPEYKLPITENMELQTEFYTDLSTSDLAKKGYKLKQIDMIVKGREARKYLEKTKSKDTSISMHEQTSTNEIGPVMEDIYNRGDDIYKMSMKEWITKIPEYFAEGGQVPGFATGGVSNLFRKKFNKGSMRKRLQKDYESLTKGADWMRTAPPKWWLFPEKYGMTRDDAMTWFKERFMYGDLDAIPTPLEAFKQSPELVKFKEWLAEREGHATGGVSNLFRERQGYRGGKAVELVTKLPEFLKFVERLLIKASNEIRQGIGKWKDLTTSQRVTQHDNLTKLATEFQKTKKFDVRINEYTGIDAEKAFVEVQAKVAPVNERTLLQKKYPGITDDLLDKILVDKNPQRKAEVLATMDEYLKLRQVGKGEEEAYEIITESIKKPTHHATGGLIPGYATGGVSNLFRSR